VSLSAYKAGKISVLDLIDSERTLLEFERVLWREKSNYLINRAGLEALCGGEIE
jgi:outer membrane protein TolC